MSGKVKLFKNSARNTPDDEEISAYVPQYQLSGIEPKHIGSMKDAHLIMSSTPKHDLNNPRIKRVPVIRDYAVEEDADVGVGTGSTIPNVGNSMEHSWSSIDDEPIVEEDYEVVQPKEDVHVEESSNDISSLKDNSYIILVGGKVISVGTFKNIQQEVSDLVLGKHKLISEYIDVKDIIVLKKVNIKVGVFLAE